ncbi:uncharacterized protein DUF4291 [Kribbella sp. VKM Ac-2569]|uniref:DUF4291 domain-containing protein n=1 Tax=Kribbella sp. VKM Ac-2569 TaxID=2512220 RepID=UPI00102BF754|nr:DUF4291 domain-containing protein [Kribbella sp. VKM Ac-2569]RZT07404.1 uncharacterized protein DUF4291 [Kribbella sp. VKM Ac-2569]
MVAGVVRQVRALYDGASVAVYQAYSSEIAEPALAAGRFVEPFGMGRMTWIKPSFLWMAYRSGWGTKPGQTRVLRVDITREGFEWALGRGVLSHYEAGFHESEAAWKASLTGAPVRIQWDPEQTVTLTPEPRVRSIQIGLSGEAVRRYVNEWIVGLEDVTAEMHRVRDLAQVSRSAAEAELPAERPYPISDELAVKIAASPGAHVAG